MSAGPLLSALEASARTDASHACEILSQQTGTACLLGPAGEILFTNEAWDSFAASNGGAPLALGSAVLGKRYTNFVYGLAERSFHDGVLLRVQSGQLVSFRARCDGPEVEREIESVFRPVRLGSGLGVQVIHSVVRETHRRDPAPRSMDPFPLGAEGKRLESLLATTRDLLVVIDERGRVLRAFHNSVRSAPRLYVGSSILKTIHGEDAPSVLKALREATRGVAARAEARLEGVGTFVLDFGPHPISAHRGEILVGGRDVTRERRLEAELLRSQRLEAVARLAGGIAHDFNNVLTVILACADDTSRSVAEGRPVDATALDEICAAANRGTDLARQLLRIGRREGGESGPVDPNKIISAIEKILRRLLGEDVKLEVVLCEEAWPASADPILLDQVIMNLVVNARDALPHGGTLRVKTGNFRSANHEGDRFGVGPGDFAWIAVSDDGTGMAPEVAARIFEPFFTTKGEGVGSGLGLSIVQRIVREAKGGIAVTTAPGKGTTFEIVLPRASQTVTELCPSTFPPRRARPSRGNERLLVVEDDPLLREVMARTLRKAGHEVLSAGTGAEALALCGDPSLLIHLVVCDVVLPGLSGPRVVNELRRLRPQLPVLYASGHDPRALAARSALPATATLLMKPFTSEAFLAAVRTTLESVRSPGASGPAEAALTREQGAS